MYMRLGLRGAIVISSPEVAKEVLKNHDVVFCNRPHLIIANLLVVTNQGGYRCWVRRALSLVVISWCSSCLA
jgi:hypothetical protein